MRRWWGLCWLALAIGCGEGGPPLDELPLRDALQVAPAVVAGLPVEERARLAIRLEAARTSDLTSDRVGDGPPEVAVDALDRLRVERNADPLLAGIIADGRAWPLADPLVGAPGDATVTPTALPPVEGEPAGETAPLEARALDGAAGATLRALLTASGARHLWRVTGWPMGAVAIDGTIYVNASWLVALAPVDAAAGASVQGGSDGGSDGGSVDGGLDGATSAQSGSSGLAPVQGAEASAPSVPDGGGSSEIDGGASAPTASPSRIAEGASGLAFDGGTTTFPPPPSNPPPPPSTSPGFWDACGAGADACDSTDTSSCDGSTDDGSDDSCSGSTDDGSDGSCTPPPDDGGGCQVAHGGHRTRYGTIFWMLAPLGFLLGRRP